MLALMNLGSCKNFASGNLVLNGKNTGTITGGSTTDCTTGNVGGGRHHHHRLQEMVWLSGRELEELRYLSGRQQLQEQVWLSGRQLQNLVSCPAGQQYDNEAGQCAVIITNTGTMNISLI